MADQIAAVAVQWQTADALKTATIQVTATGLELDAALDALLAGLDGSAVGYVVTRAMVVETVEREHRPRPSLEERSQTVRDVAPAVQVEPAARPGEAPVRSPRGAVSIVRGALR